MATLTQFERPSTLREFQARLSEKLRAAAIAPVRNARLGIQVGEERYLVRLEEAGEITSVPTMTQVPMTRDWFRGVCNLRGRLHAVTDISRFYGGSFTPIDREARLLSLGESLNFNAAILVSRLLGLKNIDQMELDLAVPTEEWIGALYRDSQGLVWRELNLSQLAKNEQFLLIGRS